MKYKNTSIFYTLLFISYGFHGNFHFSGEKFPNIEYNEEEHKTWEVVFNKLKEFHLSHACVEYQQKFKQMELEGLLEPNRIPKLHLINKYLRRKNFYKVSKNFSINLYLINVSFNAVDLILTFKKFHFKQCQVFQISPRNCRKWIAYDLTNNIWNLEFFEKYYLHLRPSHFLLTVKALINRSSKFYHSTLLISPYNFHNKKYWNSQKFKL